MLSVNVPDVEEHVLGEELLDNVLAKIFEQLSHLIPLPKMEYNQKIIMSTMSIIMRIQKLSL